MSFSDFQNVEQVIKKYPLQIQQKKFLPDSELAPPGWFIENISFYIEMKGIDENEAFYTESFIYPCLSEIWKKHKKLKLWSHRALDFEGELFGEPDYILSYISEGVIDKIINKPLLAVAEAKKENFTQGWGQCLAEMLACQKINGEEKTVVYGIVSNGIFWEFSQLEGNKFTKHPIAYSIHDPKKLFGALDFLFKECEKQVS